MAVPLSGRRNVAVVGGHVYVARAAFARPLRHSHDHGPASNIGERLSREPTGRKSRRDNGGEGHVEGSRRRPPPHPFYFSSGGHPSPSPPALPCNISPNRTTQRRALLQY